MIKTCLEIFLARLTDVSLGTLKTVYSVKGRTLIASLIAFIEVFIWFMVAKEALNSSLDSLWIPLSYALGYASGTLLGTFIASNYIKGTVCIQVITDAGNYKMINKIRQAGFGVSILTLKNDYDDKTKEMLLIEINKRSLKQIISIIEKTDKKAFFMVHETKIVANGLIK